MGRKESNQTKIVTCSYYKNMYGDDYLKGFKLQWNIGINFLKKLFIKL